MTSYIATFPGSRSARTALKVSVPSRVRVAMLSIACAITALSLIPAHAHAAGCTPEVRATWSTSGLLSKSSTVSQKGCATESAPGQVSVTILASQTGSLSFHSVDYVASFTPVQVLVGSVPVAVPVYSKSCQSTLIPPFSGVIRCDLTFTNLPPYTTYTFRTAVNADVKDDGSGVRSLASSTSFTRVLYSR